MDMLEHFEDNLNTNISNSVNMANFLKVANTVKKNLNTKYHNGEFADPAVGAYDEKWIWLLSQWILAPQLYKGCISLAPFLIMGGCQRL